MNGTPRAGTVRLTVAREAADDPQTQDRMREHARLAAADAGCLLGRFRGRRAHPDREVDIFEWEVLDRPRWMEDLP